MKNALAAAFLIVSFLITLWTWAFLEQVSWMPFPGGSGVGSGIATAFSLTLLRWLALSAAFVFLLMNGRLNGWAHYTILRIILAIVGITLMEICMFAVHIRCVDVAVAPHFRFIFKCLVILLPLSVMAGGYLGSLSLFALGAVGSLVAAVWPIPSYTPPPPDQNSIEYLLQHADADNDRKDILSRLEKHPGWVKQVSRSLDGGWDLNAAVLLSLKPAALGEDVQERCWKVVLWNLARVKPIRDSGGNWMPTEVRSIALIVQGLATIPGPVRERHHANFVVIRDLVNFYRNETPETRYPELPDLRQADWEAVGK
jgi:hypothetical protein